MNLSASSLLAGASLVAAVLAAALLVRQADPDAAGEQAVRLADGQVGAENLAASAARYDPNARRIRASLPYLRGVPDALFNDCLPVQNNDPTKRNDPASRDLRRLPWPPPEATLSTSGPNPEMNGGELTAAGMAAIGRLESADCD